MRFNTELHTVNAHGVTQSFNYSVQLRVALNSVLLRGKKSSTKAFSIRWVVAIIVLVSVSKQTDLYAQQADTARFTAYLEIVTTKGDTLTNTYVDTAKSVCLRIYDAKTHRFIAPYSYNIIIVRKRFDWGPVEGTPCWKESHVAMFNTQRKSDFLMIREITFQLENGKYATAKPITISN